jgi:hypothetical protein
LRAPLAVTRAGLASFVAAGFAAAGCTVGSGVGSAVGTLQDVGCDVNNSRATPEPYSLNPTFFAGEPIEDVCPSPPGNCSTNSPHTNRLLIRMQRTGNGAEVTDVLYFDVLDSLKVAQCVRGQTIGGAPTWDTRDVTAADGFPIPGVPWCDWNWTSPDGGTPADGGADGGLDAGVPGTDGGAFDGGADAGVPVQMSQQFARINLSTQDFVQASLTPLYTCVEARSVAVALPGSWVQFADFGDAIETNLAPADRGSLSGDYAVQFGQRLHATFHLILGDQAVEYAIQTRTAIPDLRISGELDGSFDFDLDRGRAAQPFP